MTEPLHPLVEAPTVDQGQRSVAVAYLLLIFVGATGAHRVYLGRTGSAVAILVPGLVRAAALRAVRQPV